MPLFKIASSAPKKKTSVKKGISKGTTKNARISSGKSSRKSERSRISAKKASHPSSKPNSATSMPPVSTTPLASANPDTIRELKQVFRLFDKDGDNSITINELRGVLTSLGVACENDELDAMMKHVDTNGDAQIDFEEFYTLMTSGDHQKENDEELEAREAFKIFDRSEKSSPQDLYIVMKNLGEEGITMEDVEELIRDADAG
eukprot:CAMPEP_0117445266 /NCGR_PEP_ID=MMETSP0759-20121206/5700_1 /TAXON_ID=63605 /ORGANISM="Percolomonas cosmopolitus, Strain WS" /LENGTH=202 /DNA_ID=CAMNT_0005237423 /DNA_START=72 /DNA_END=676 /DNA_ORIENTATION=-